MIDLHAAAAVDLTHEPVAAGQVVEGAPTTGYAALGEFGGQEYGVWEMSVGAMSDVEEDELFIVISGSGELLLEGGETRPLEIGVVGRLEAGQRTVWTVTSTLRKVYVSGASISGAGA